MTQEALKLALEALEQWNTPLYKRGTAITAIKEALAQTERPVDCERCNRLEDALKRANGLAEHFERAWYLRGDEIERLTAQPEQEPVAYTGNGTAGRGADVRPTGFFFQMPKSVGEVYGWHGAGKGQPMCRFNASEAEMPVGTKLYTTPPQRTWVGLTDEERFEVADISDCFEDVVDAVEAKLKEKNNG